MKNNEFKITKFKESTVYTLESATAGGTSAGSVASVSKPIGGVQRRTGDNFFTQEDADPIKPRRGPLRPQTGGGSHKDRTKTIPRKEKHRKPMDMAEGATEGSSTAYPAIYIKGGGEYPGQQFAPKGYVRIKDVKDEGSTYFVIIGDEDQGFYIPKGKTSQHQIKLQNGMGITAKQAYIMFNGRTPEGGQGVAETKKKSAEQRLVKSFDQAQKSSEAKKIRAERDREEFNKSWDAKKADNKDKTKDVVEGRYEFDKKTGQMAHNTTDADQRHGLYIDGKLVKTYNSREACDNVKRRDPKFKSATIKKIAEGLPKDPNAPKKVQDRKTGKQYDPNKSFDKTMKDPKVKDQLKRMAQKEGVAEGLNEFAPTPSGDDDFDPALAAEAKQDGINRGVGLTYTATVERALRIDHNVWRDSWGGQYLSYFVSGFMEGRKIKMDQARRDGVELVLQKNGSLRHKESNVAEGSEIKIPTDDGITMQDIRLVAGEGKLSSKTIKQAIAVIRKQRRPQGVAEAGNKPLEKSYFGTGDTRTPRDIKSQMSGASDEFVKSTADKTTGPFHSKVAKMQGKMAKSELRKREQGVAEATGDKTFDKMLKGITSKTAVTKQQKIDRREERKQNQERAKNAFGNMFGGPGAGIGNLSIRKGPPKDVTEDEYDRVEFLANVMADYYWSSGMTSSTEKRNTVRDIIQAVKDGRLSVEQLEQDVRDLDDPGMGEDHSTATGGWGQGSMNSAYKSSALAGAGHDDRMMEDEYIAKLSSRLEEKLAKNAPVKAYIDDFAKAAKTPNAKGHHQFKNKSPEKVRQMAMAASYAAKNPSKKK